MRPPPHTAAWTVRTSAWWHVTGTAVAALGLAACAAIAPPATGPAPAVRPAPVHLVVGLGDSVPAGSGCTCPTFVTRVAARLGTRQQPVVHADDLAVPGQTTQGLLDQLGDPAVASAVSAADIVLVTVGANDFDDAAADGPADQDTAPPAAYRTALQELRARYTRLLDRLTELARPQARLVVTGYWNVFLDGAVGRARGTGYVSGSDALTRAVNDVVATAATAATGRAVTYADLYTPYKAVPDDTSLLAPDGDHPDDAGHDLIASIVLRALGTT